MAGRGKAPAPAEELLRTIQQFLAQAAQPVLLEPGVEAIPIREGHYALDEDRGRLYLHAWDDRSNLRRRVTGITAAAKNRLDLEVRRFGDAIASCALLDIAHPRQQQLSQRGSRHAFRERFRRFLQRQFPGSRIDTLSTDPDLTRSLSPSYPRALFSHHGLLWAAIGADGHQSCPDGLLTFGLIWLAYLRQQRMEPVRGLVVLLPSGQTITTHARIALLASPQTGFRLFTFEGDDERELDPTDCGNLETFVEDRTGFLPPDAVPGGSLLKPLQTLEGVETVPLLAGALSLRVRGLEFARWTPDKFVYGLETKQPARASNLPEVEALARELARRRSPNADSQHPLRREHPELWLESQVRRNLETIDPTLIPSPVYGQVPAFSGGDRTVIDLLACSRSGRLTVIELKAAEDIQLPLQALDYWMRVAWHAKEGSFRDKGYFSPTSIITQPPRLILVAPALQFHPMTEAILNFFPPEVEVIRIGVGMEWQRELRVMFRLERASTPFFPAP